jgi:DNA-binding transcriptional LysR family regulator
MTNFTLHELLCFDAVVRTGGFQAAAEQLHRSHPAVFAAVAKLERQLGLPLLDRSGYRVKLTEAGRSLHRRVQFVLREMESLSTHASQLAMGVESELRVVVGDFCPRPRILQTLSRFFARCPGTRLRLDMEAVGGPLERLLEGEADLILHRIVKSDPGLEYIELGRVHFVPVVAPGFLPFPVTSLITPDQMRGFTQCVIRDTARSKGGDYFLVEGAHQCTVPDQLMKKELILQGMAWGHVPHFLIEEELRDGRLQSIAGASLPEHVEDLVAARQADRPHGPIAAQLWDELLSQAPALRASLSREVASA